MRKRTIPTGKTLLGLLASAALVSLASNASALALLVPEDARFQPLELESQVMTVKIDNQTAQTRIRQVFFNRYSRPIEATYLLPIPKGAHVTDFAMEINGKKVNGEVLEKDKARRIYTDIVRRLRDPGLLEYVDQQIFRARVFPIPPRERQKIEITVTHLLPLDNGIVEYEWPFEAPAVVKRRGHPASPGEFDLRLDIRSKVPIKSVYSPTHEIEVKRKDDHRAVVTLAAPPGRDEPVFRCYYTLSGKAVGLHVLTSRAEGADGTFLLMISPGKFYNEAEIQPVDFTLVLDTSGSMNDDGKIDAAKKALNYCLGALRADDAFNIVRFSTEVESFAQTFLPANEANIKRARKFVKTLRARGGTNIDQALATALDAKVRKGRIHTILFITDGKPTVGVTNIDRILKNVEKHNTRGLRIFVCGVGYDVNTKLLDRLAGETRAVAEYIRPKEDLEVAVSNLFDKISHPVLTDLEIDWGGLKVRKVYPAALPDLFMGSQLTVLGRYENGGHYAIALTGRVGNKEKTFVYEADFPKKPHRQHAFIETLWAARRVGYLLDQIRTNGESKELRNEVVRLAKKYGIVTPYTSYLVQEDRTVAAYERGRRVRFSSAPSAPAAAPARARVWGRRAAPAPASGGSLGTPVEIEAQDNAWGFGRARKAPHSAPLSALTGRAAVEMSKGLSELKGAESIAAAGLERPPETRFAAGREFRLENGVWTEVKSEKSLEEKKYKTLKIKYLSDAYFAVLDIRPDLKKVFALGDRVVFYLDGLKIVIGPEGKNKLGPSELRLLRTRKTGAGSK